MSEQKAKERNEVLHEIEHADDRALIALRADPADLEEAKKARESDGAQPEKDASHYPAAAKAIAEFFEGEEAEL